MELIIKDGLPTDCINQFPEEKFWVDAWLSDQNIFEFQTSGSTGPPKTILFSREQIVKSAKRTAFIFSWFAGMNALHSLPMNYVAGRMNVLRALICKQSLWRLDPKVNFSELDFKSQVEINWWTLTPAMLDSFLKLESVDLKKAILLVGGGRMSDVLVQRAKASKVPIWESYGAAETLTHVALRKINGSNAQQGFLPIPHVTLTTNELGVFIQDDLLNQAIQSMDQITNLPSGEFLILGRTDDIINSGGVKIFPSSVEAIIEAHVSFESFVKRSMDDVWGEVVTWVIPEDAVIPENWNAWFEDFPLLKPKKIERVKELPRNKNGKWIRK